MPAGRRAVRVTAIAASAQLGGTERVLLDFAARAFEHDTILRVLSPRDGPLIGILHELGVPAEVVPAGPGLLRGATLAGVWSWSRDLARHPFLEDADTIYTVALKAHLAIARLRRHPVVWHLHEYPPKGTGMLWRTLRRWVADAVIANSEATALAWGIRATGNGQRATVEAPRFPLPVERCTVVKNGVDLDRFRPRPRAFWIHQRLGIPRAHRLIGMPAVFAPWKGQLAVIKAFSVVRSRFPDVHLVIVGGCIYDTAEEAEYAAELESAVRVANGSGERGAGLPHVHILPFQRKVELVYPEVDLVVHYSLKPEPFGRVILEAIASGVPVIAAGEGGPVEILGEGGGGNVTSGGQRATHNVQRTACGWLAPPRDPPALANVLREALELPADRLRAMGEEARRRAEDHFSARWFARRVADVLRHTVAGLATGSE